MRSHTQCVLGQAGPLLTWSTPTATTTPPSTPAALCSAAVQAPAHDRLRPNRSAHGGLVPRAPAEGQGRVRPEFDAADGGRVLAAEERLPGGAEEAGARGGGHGGRQEQRGEDGGQEELDQVN